MCGRNAFFFSFFLGVWWRAGRPHLSQLVVPAPPPWTTRALVALQIEPNQIISPGGCGFPSLFGPPATRADDDDDVH